jgi:hypothetical protein
MSGEPKAVVPYLLADGNQALHHFAAAMDRTVFSVVESGLNRSELPQLSITIRPC